MPLVNYVCWERARAFDVLNISAENVPDEIFLAVHSEHRLPIVDTNGTDSGESVEARELLRRFLEPKERHMQVVVQGDSGSGKSHLIKWMSLNIPSTKARLVLTVPRAGMSLRHIVEKIIAQLPASQRQRYQGKLEQAGDQAGTPEQQRGILLSHIAAAIKSDAKLNGKVSVEEAWLIQEVPKIFLDTQLRMVLDRPDGVIGELVAHIFDDQQEYQRVQNERLFMVEDLPAIEHVHRAALPTQEVLTALWADPGVQRIALEIINRNLGRAIATVLHLGGNQLVNIMAELRQHLRRDGKSLILLIEDFARLQGVDGEMLQALSQESSDTNGLCDLRWAMAVTSGYYKRVQETVQTRMNYLVDMNLPTSGGNAIIGDDQIVAFVSRYLNAVRLHPDALRQWKERAQGGQAQVPVPNACSQCPYVATCHEVFGEEGDVGLYPFTRNAILNMAHRRDSRLNRRFNPRILVKDVLKEVLAIHVEEITGGEYPATSLMNTMGGPKLPPGFVERLSRSNPHFDRHHAVLELYSGNLDAPAKLPDGLYEAFSLKPAPDLAIDEPPPGGGRGGKDDPPPPPSPPTFTLLERRVEVVRGWGRSLNMSLTDQVAQKLRDLVFATLEDYVDWDAPGVHRADLVQRDGKIFRARYIELRNGGTKAQIPRDVISLPIPLNDNDDHERRKAALALEGLLRFAEAGHWNFPDGAVMLAALGECLERWSAYLLDQLRRIPDPEGAWDHIASTVEMLAVGAALAGRPAKVGATVSDHLNALLEPWPAPPSEQVQSEPWSKLYKELYQVQPQLKSVLKTWAYGTKGGRAEAFTDPSKLVPALERIRYGWVPAVIPPKAKHVRRTEDLERVRTVFARVHSELSSAAVAERQRRIAWLDQTRQRVPEETTWQETLGALGEVLQVVINHGLPCRADVVSRFKEGLQTFAQVKLDAEMARLEPLREVRDALGILPQLGEWNTGSVIRLADTFFKSVDEFLIEVEAKVNTQAAAEGTEGAELEQHMAKLEQGLKELGDTLAAMGGTHAQ